MPNRTGARGLVFGGLMAALTAVIVYLVPFPFVYPLPLTLVYIRHGARSALTTGVATALLLTVIMGGINGLVVIPSVVLPALAMGYGVTQGLAPVVTIAATSVAAFVAILTNLGLTFLMLGQNPVEMLIRMQVEAMEQARNMVQAMGAANPQMVEMLDVWTELMPMLISRLLPALLLLAAVLMAMGMYWIARLTLPRFGHQIQPLTPFTRWSAPIWLSWTFLGALGVSFLGGQGGTALEWVQRLGLNIAVAIGFVYLVIGVAVAFQWLSTRIGKGPTILLLVLGYLYVAPVLVFVGMWDGLFDFRKLRTESQGGNQS